MALETLKNVKQIDDFDVVVMDELKESMPELFNESGAMDWKYFEENIRPKNFIYIRNDKNSISFTIQNGPIKEVGANGCQVDTLVAAAQLILEGLNKNFPCRENSIAITKLQEAYFWLKQRQKNRTQRGVEGHSKA